MELPVSGEQRPVVEWKNKVLQWGRRRLCLTAVALVCLVAILVTVLVSLPRPVEETGTSVLLPEDGIISATFIYQGNYADVIIIDYLHKLSCICIFLTGILQIHRNKRASYKSEAKIGYRMRTSMN
jgi:hypothetical protein